MWIRKEWPNATSAQKVFGNVFESRESKYYGVLMKYCHKIKDEQVITLQLAQELKSKNINVVPGQLLTIGINYWDRLTVLMIKIKLSLLQMLTINSLKRLQSIGILPVSLQALMKTLKSDISEAYKVQVDCLKDSESDS